MTAPLKAKAKGRASSKELYGDVCIPIKRERLYFGEERTGDGELAMSNETLSIDDSRSTIPNSEF